ncbi:hypothetical protein [Bacillus alkalicellulosilyticus]|uniref:hypothetical protein n=1 Tax=Alkalihalobacterium alkalicellulosilyticum TaxID=1912214 RepID=UPI000996DCC6|nr:hypothetical protein [Bacillus alkalicellulosilyticus]
MEKERIKRRTYYVKKSGSGHIVVNTDSDASKAMKEFIDALEDDEDIEIEMFFESSKEDYDNEEE